MVVGEFTQDADIVVIGAGPAGHACACRAAELGRAVTLIDTRPALGGACLHDACIPSKTLLHAIDKSCGERVDHVELSAWIQRVTRRLAGGLASGASARSVEVLQGTARFLGSREIQVAGEHISRLRFKRAVICCGSAARPVDGSLHATDVVSSLDRLQGTIAVLGDGTWAVEAASICAAMGCDTTLFPCSPSLLPSVPESLTTTLQSAAGWTLGPTGQVETNQSDAGWSITHGGECTAADLVIDARLTPPDLRELGLDTAGVTLTDVGCVAVNTSCVTSEPRILAAGVCTEAGMNAGAAAAQGRVAAEVIAGLPAGWEPAAVPTIAFSAPQLAWSGTCESSASHVDVPWAFSGLAVAMKAGGMTALYWDPDTGTVLGAGAVGRSATEHADLFTLSIELGATIQDLADVASAHPTRSELLIEAARQAIAMT